MGISAHALKGWLDAGLSFLYPENCQLCEKARATYSESYVCSTCREKVRFIDPPFCEFCGLPYEGAITTEFRCANCSDVELHFSSARSAVVARDPVLDVIHRYKYHRALWFEPFLAELLAQKAVPDLARGKWDLLVPIPLHAAKEREREFNQAERLSRCLGKATSIPLGHQLLQRIIPTRTQTQLSRLDRVANVRRAFALRDPATKLTGQRIVLVDDVFTTGATSNACARVLKAAGAAEVCVWTVARGT